MQNAKKDTTLGLYVPASIASEVQAQASATKAARAQAVLSKDTREGNKTRALLLAAYPNMPAADLSQILSHAFLKGSRRVGRSSKVRGGEKVKLRLAVEAHIRHCHTEYDRMLREGIHREDAREMVWEEVGRIRDEWAGRQEGEGGEGSESESVVEMEDEVDNVSDSEPDVIVLDSDSDEG
ncbi:hypothetical protein KEM55_002813 [Ascosphaera atra]|nr:hypothetical protein KEM55_002813 [Ascosphaera atra]